MAAGAAFGAYRYALGLGPASNLSHDYPWGIWKAVNVAAIAAIGSSGFTLTAVVHVAHKHKYHAMMRPGLVLALLCYTFVGVALMMLASNRIETLLGKTGLNVLSKVSGLILAAMAADIVFTGIVNYFRVLE